MLSAAWRWKPAAACLAVGVWIPAFDLLANDEGQLVLWGVNRLPKPGALWFASGLICVIALLSCAVAVGLVSVVAGRIGSRLAPVLGGVSVAVLFGICSLDPDWLDLPRRRPFLALGLLIAVGALGALSVTRSAFGRHAGRLALGAPLAATLVLGAKLAGNLIAPSPCPSMVLRGLLGLAIGASSLLGAAWLHSLHRTALVRIYATLVAALLGGLSWPLWGGPSRAEIPRLAEKPLHVPRVILITVDTLRRDAISAFGGDTTTPHIDALAAESLVFSNAYSPSSWTLPSMVSLVTGLDPRVHGVITEHSLMPASVRTLAELLGERGYATHSIGYNPFLSQLRGPGSGVQQGFETQRFAPAAQGPLTLVSDWLFQVFPSDLDYFFTTRQIGESAADWISTHSGWSFFLWAHFFDPHLPYGPDVEFLDRTRSTSSSRTFFAYAETNAPERYSDEELRGIRDLYDAEVLSVDHQVGRILEVLRARDLYEDSLIILTSDHGDEFREHGDFDHGQSLYEELLAVPLLIKLPRARRHARLDARVSTTDLFPTILDLTGTQYNADILTAETLTPYWAQAAGPIPAREIFGAGSPGSRHSDSVLFGKYKYLSLKNGARGELYDLVADPYERNNISVARADLVEQGKGLLERRGQQTAEVRRIWNLTAAPQPAFDRSTSHILKSAGYLQ